MKLPGMLPFRFIAIWLAVLSRAAHGSGDGLSQEYCSGENTASDYNAVYNIYNSNGACYQQCLRNYAFAVVQGQNCWCSNYIPADQQSTGGCNQKCPGYPDDLCGNESNGLFGYISLPNVQPSGTAGASSSDAASSTAAPSSTEATSDQPSSTPQSSDPETSSGEPATSYTPSSSSSSSSASPTTSSAPPSTSSTDTPYVAPVPATSQATTRPPTASATPSPVTSVRVVTLSGAVVTQTVTSTPMVAPGSDSQTEPLQQKRISGGAIAGIVVGSIIGTAALLIGGFLLWRRSRQNGEVEAAGAGTRRGPNSPRRNISVLSKTGLLSRGRPMSYNEKDFDDQMYVNTGNNSVRHSMLFGAGGAGEGVSPVSPLGSSHDNDSSRRFSRPLVYDQRLNPSALFANAEANGSRVSMQDQQDYSRPLGVANPDPRPSFDSRISRG